MALPHRERYVCCVAVADRVALLARHLRCWRHSVSARHAQLAACAPVKRVQNWRARNQLRMLLLPDCSNLSAQTQKEKAIGSRYWSSRFLCAPPLRPDADRPPSACARPLQRASINRRMNPCRVFILAHGREGPVFRSQRQQLPRGRGAARRCCVAAGERDATSKTTPYASILATHKCFPFATNGLHTGAGCCTTFWAWEAEQQG